MKFHRVSLSQAILAAMMMTTCGCGLSAQTAAPQSVMSLDQAIQYGLADSPQLRQAEADVQRASAAMTGIRGTRLPQINAAEEVALSDDPVFAFGTKLRQGRFTNSDFDLHSLNEPRPISNFASSVDATWTAFDFGARENTVRSSRSAVEASKLTRQFSEEEVANTITGLFYRVLLAEGQLAVAKTAVARAQEIDTDIKDRIHAGLSLEADGLRSSALLRSAEDDLATTQSNVQLSRADFFNALGQPASSIPLIPPESKASSPPGDPGQLIRRPDIQSLDWQRKSVQQKLDATRLSALPRVEAYGHVEADNPHIFGGGGRDWTVGAKLELHIFDGGVRKAHQQEEEAELRRLSGQKEQALRDARSHLSSIQAQLEDLRRRYETLGQTIEADGAALRASRDRYDAGLISISDVLNQEVELSTAEYARIRAHYEICILTSDLRLADGTLTTTKAGHP
ncbi:MAG TPA: TolC family protein [Acidobacteriaceae bacterium]|nr:TolC family protein [Acidobacteriaceae bacterium]